MASEQPLGLTPKSVQRFVAGVSEGKLGTVGKGLAVSTVSLSADERKALRRRLLRQTASDVAVIVGSIDTVDEGGNVCLPKPTLVPALAGYFGDILPGRGRQVFIEQAYGPGR